MPRLAVKLLISLAVGLAAGGVLWFALPERAPSDMVLHRPDVPVEIPAPGWAAGAAAGNLARLPSPFEVEHPVAPPSSFRRWALGEGAARQLFEVDEHYLVYDPWCYFHRVPFTNLKRPWEEHPQGVFMMRTNSLGLRMDGEPSPRPPDLRVLIAGDSHVDGVCFNREGYPALLEAALAAERPGETVEVVNAACGGYSFYHYLGTLERLLSLSPDVFVVTVYGGNDFGEGLQLYHRFAGTAPPERSEEYDRLVGRAQTVSVAALSQAFLSYKLFDTFPGESEEALQMARDVSTEILVTCLRQGIRPVFVYLPPAADVEWDVHAEALDGVREALALGREDLGTLDRIADAYLAFLEERRIEVLDLRPVFEGAAGPLFWERDQHLNLRGQETVARALLPLLRDARPPGSRRVRPARSALEAKSYELGSTLRSPGVPGRASPREIAGGLGPSAEGAAAPRPEIQTVGGDWVTLPALEHRPLGAGAALELHPSQPHRRYDPLTYVELEPGLAVELPWDEHPDGAYLLRTNSFGMRSDSEVLEQRPDLRILIAGDGHVDGAFDNLHSLAGQLVRIFGERHPALLVEALAAGSRGHSFLNYMGVLRKHARHRPDLFLVVVDGGDDFFELLDMHRRVESSDAPEPSFGRPLEEALALWPEAVRAFLLPALYFAAHGEQKEAALRLGEAATLALQRACDAAGMRLAVVYVPPATEVQWDALEAEVRPHLERLGLSVDQLRALGKIGDAYVAEMRAAGVRVIDMRPRLEARKKTPFWLRDHHLNLRGQNETATMVAGVVERWFSLDRE